jgi:hypothetical protein
MVKFQIWCTCKTLIGCRFATLLGWAYSKLKVLLKKILFKFYEIFLCGRRVGQSYADWTSHGQGRKKTQLFEEKTTLKVITEPLKRFTSNFMIFLYGRRVGQSYADWTSHGQGRKTTQLFEEKTTLKVIYELCIEQSNKRYSSADAR